MSDARSQSLALAFLERFWTDRDAGQERGLADYLAQFPGDEQTIAGEYLAALIELRSEGDDEDGDFEGDDGRVGPYRLIEELGRGGQGVVWLAEDTRLHRNVALKVLTGLGPGAEGHLARFKREAALASKLEHPGICGVHDTGIEGGVPYIAMRHVDGETLGDRLSRLRSETTAAEPSSFMSFDDDDQETATSSDSSTASSTIDRHELERAIAAFEKIASALHAAHEVGIVHRDIKPGNIMITAENEPILLDFGLAHDDSDDAGPSLTQTGDLFGTPAYMSPEQITGRRVRLDRRSDIYSLGVTLYECLTMKRPFEAPTREALYQAILSKEPDRARKLNRQIPSDLEVVLQCAMDKDRDKRYQTAADLAEDLRRVREGEPILARKVSLLGRAWRWSRRQPAAAALICALVLGIPTITGLGVWYWDHRDEVAAQKQAALFEAMEEQLEIGFYEMSEGLLSVAVTAFEEALALDPGSAEATVGLALARLKQKQPGEALEVLERSVADPGVLARTKSSVLHALGRESEAAAVLADAPEAKGALMWFLEGQNKMLEGQEQLQLSSDGIAAHAAFAKAESLFLRAVQASTRVRRAYHFELASAANRSKSPRVGAIVDAIEALWPDSKLAWAAIASSLWNDPDRKHMACREALRLGPEEHWAYLLLGRSFADQGKLEEAAAAYREGLRRDPHDWQGHVHLAYVLERQGKLDEAIAAVREGLRVGGRMESPHGHMDSVNHLWLGCALNKQGKPDEAILACREALRLKPNYSSPHTIIGTILDEKGKFDEAISEFREALRLDPNDFAAHMGLGLSLASRGKIEQSIASLREATRLKPDEASTHDRLGTICELAGRFEEAKVAFSEAIRLDPDNASFHYSLGVVLLRQGENEEAIVSNQEAIRLDPDLAEAHANLGIGLARAGRNAEAAVAARQALAIKPHLGPAQQLLADLQRRAGSVADLRADVEANPEDPHRLNALAWALVDPSGDASIRDPEEALPLAHRAVALSGRRNAAILDTLAVALAANEDYEEAIAVQEELLRLMHGKDVSGMTVAESEAALARYREALRAAREEQNENR